MGFRATIRFALNQPHSDPKGFGMSHQDQDGRTCFRFHHQALLAAIRWLWDSVAFDRLRLRQDCTWSARALATAGLLWAWSDELTLSDRFTKARQMTMRMLRLSTVPAGTYQAFLKRLGKWTPALVELLQQAFRRRMRRRFAKRMHVGKFVIFGVDGSRLQLPRTKSNEAAYAPDPKRPRKRKRCRKPRQKQADTKKANSPQMWVTTLWHLGTQLPWDWRFGPSDSSERDHARQMIDRLPADSLLVADAGFTGYELWSQFLSAGCQLVIRVGSNVRLLKKLGYARQDGGLVYCWPDAVARQELPPLVFRLVVMTGKRHPIYLITSVLDRKQLSDHDVARIYRRRWGIELFYRHLKQTFDRRKLRSKNAQNARVEAEWSLLGLWAMALHAQAFQQSQRLDPTQLSVAGMLRAYRRAMREYKSEPEPGEDLLTMLKLALKDDYERASKTSRDYPRKKRETAAGPPQILTATKAQVQNAAKIKRELTKGLTA